MPEQRMKLTIRGRVQGVGFRNFTKKTVSKLREVTGWVKNEPDGTVSLVAEGPEDELEQLHNAVKKGPSFAEVTGIDQTWTESTAKFDTFKVRY